MLLVFLFLFFIIVETHSYY